MLGTATPPVSFVEAFFPAKVILGLSVAATEEAALADNKGPAAAPAPVRVVEMGSFDAADEALPLLTVAESKT